MRQRFSRFLFPLLMAGLMCGSGQTQQQDKSKEADTQKRHEIHTQGYHAQWRETIPELLAKRTGDLHLTYNQPPGFTGGIKNPPAYPPYPLPGMACNSDAVVEARAQTAVSYLTKDQTFVYTDWTFTVLHVLKDNSKSPTAIGSNIVVVQPGGKLQISGRNVSATDVNFKEFQAGERYLLFLNYVPETGAYSAAADKSFYLNGKQVVFLTKEPIYPNLEGRDSETLLNDSYAAVAAQGQGKCKRPQRPEQCGNLDMGRVSYDF